MGAGLAWVSGVATIEVLEPVWVVVTEAFAMPARPRAAPPRMPAETTGRAM